MFGPPFTATRLVFLGLFALLVWIYLAFQIRHHWRDRRERREFAQAGGLRGQRPFDRRRAARKAFAVFLVSCSIAYVYFEKFGSPQAQSRLHTIGAQSQIVMKWVSIALAA